MSERFVSVVSANIALYKYSSFPFLSFQWYAYLWAKGLWKGDEHPAHTPVAFVCHTLPLLLRIHFAACWMNWLWNQLNEQLSDTYVSSVCLSTMSLSLMCGADANKPIWQHAEDIENSKVSISLLATLILIDWWYLMLFFSLVNAMITCEIKLFQPDRRRPTEIILFQCVETCLKLFQNYFGSLLQLMNIF